MTTLTYTHARQHLAEVLSKVASTQEPAIIRRKGHEDVALVPASELASLLETAHLLRSPANAARLRDALDHSLRGETTVRDVESMRSALDVDTPATRRPAKPRSKTAKPPGTGARTRPARDGQRTA